MQVAVHHRSNDGMAALFDIGIGTDFRYPNLKESADFRRPRAAFSQFTTGAGVAPVDPILDADSVPP